MKTKNRHPDWRLRSGRTVLWECSRRELNDRLKDAWQKAAGYQDPATEESNQIRLSAETVSLTLSDLSIQWRRGDTVIYVDQSRALGLCLLLRIPRATLFFLWASDESPLIIEEESEWEERKYEDVGLVLTPAEEQAKADMAANLIKDDRGRLPVHRAAANGSPAKQIAALTEPSIPVDVEDDFGITPLGYAIQSGHPDTVIGVLRSGADADNAGHRMPHTLMATKDSQIILALLEFDANPNFAEAQSGDTPMHWLCRNASEQNREALEFLVGFGGRLTQPNNAGETPLDLLKDSPLLAFALRMFKKTGHLLD